ncbi:DUF3429 domain-containing protein [Psychrobacter sp. NG25]|uniref:DUF3429 domain-containing protein n=1 Tax=Psychrobacter sp. NG25 TaxID=2782005 RepID=UPI001883DA12|nr:DUF3429 domain-containing protein [Psychrobacter sp. NG25]MBF0658054.1 DUF3429 domain-containing protein [Psychrobacter sp. NG25]
MKKPSPYLTFAGTIPFITCAIMITMNIDSLPYFGSTADILSTYGLVIASFMAGAHWGNHLGLAEKDTWAVKLPILSNVIALSLWLGFLMLSATGFTWLLIISFGSLLVIDYALYQAKVITHHYFNVRKYVTIIVLISLMVAAIQL